MRKSISAFWAEFKAFAFKGNMIDLAVAVVIGAAFSGVINSLVKDIIMPSISYVVTATKQAADTAREAAEKTASAVGVTSKPATEPATTQAAAGGEGGAAVAAAEAAASQAKASEEKAKADADKAAAEAKAAADKKAADDKPVDFTWTIGRIKIGNFIAELLNFLLIALAVFVTIVKLLGSVMKRVGGTPKPSEPTTKECQFCLSVIPIKARKCAHCTADLPATA